MNSFESNINIQTLIGILLVAFCLLIILLGFLLWRFRFLDGKSFSFSQPLGGFLMILGAILALTSVLIVLIIRAM